MSLTSWAAPSAERLLLPIENRWEHVRQVARQARRVALAITGFILSMVRDGYEIMGRAGAWRALSLIIRALFTRHGSAGRASRVEAV
jgi:hypothetical protein